jgi:2'-5' RNA ligase
VIALNAQLGFDLGAAPETQSVFFALWPNAATRERIAAQAQRLKAERLLARGWIAPAKYHATLHHFALLPSARAAFEAAAQRAVARLALRAFVWSPDRIDSFHGRGQHPCILRGAVDPPELRALWEQLREALILEGLGKQLGRQAYTPHITLAYLPHPLDEPRTVEPLHWTVDRLALLHSIPGHPEYERLAEWPLS